MRGIELSDDDRPRRTVIERLMCDLAVDLDDVSADFADEMAMLRDFAKDGLLRLDGATVTVTETGRPWLRVICAVFDRYLQHSEARHSAAV